jgi:hypothetical protein
MSTKFVQISRCNRLYTIHVCSLSIPRTAGPNAPRACGRWIRNFDPGRGVGELSGYPSLLMYPVRCIAYDGYNVKLIQTQALPGGLIQQQDGWILQQSPCNCHSLLFTTTQPHPAFSDLRIVAIGEALNAVMHLCSLGGKLDFLR